MTNITKTVGIENEEHEKYPGHKHTFPAALMLLIPILINSLASDAQARSMQMDFDLESFYIQQDIDSSKINNGVVFRSSTSFRANWSNGIVGDYKKQFIFLSASKTGSEKISHRLQISYNGINQIPVAISSCPSTGVCTLLQVKTVSTTHTFDMDGSSWRLDLPGSPCKSGLVCEVTVPSWSLETMRKNNGSSIPFPTVLTVLDTKNRISLFDPISGKEWLTFKKPDSGPLSNLNTIRDVQLSESGKISLYYSDSALVFDFKADRVFFMTNRSISILDASVTNLMSGKLTDLYVSEASEVQDSAPFSITDTAIVWSKYYFTFDSTKQNIQDILGERTRPQSHFSKSRLFTTPNSNSLYAVSLEGQKLTVSKFDNGVFVTESSTIVASSVKESELHLIGSDVIQLTTTNATYLTGPKSGEVYSAAATGKTLELLANGTTLELQGTGNDCKWQHRFHSADETNPESGFSGKCNDRPTLTSVGIDTGKIAIKRNKVRATLISETEE